MNITLTGIGRRFNRDWVFRKVDYQFAVGHSYALLGPNGSGKSTLLQVIAGNLTPSEGSISYTVGAKPIDVEQVYRHLAMTAPYLELVEDFTLNEQIRFHFTHKRYVAGFDERSVMELLGLQQAKNKQIKYFSSGMKQRVKLVLACCADAPLVLLDEPATNLDQAGINWYLQLVEATKHNRIVLVGSNQEREYCFCESELRLTDYKA